jgi:PHP family Zn ribbon phosphoesterase
VRTLKGVFIPAHVDRPRNSIISQLGFMPDNLRPDAIEINGVTEKKDFLIKYPEFKKFTLIKNSDSHTLLQIGCRFSSLRLEGLSFSEIVLALHNEQGRAIV